MTTNAARRSTWCRAVFSCLLISGFLAAGSGVQAAQPPALPATSAQATKEAEETSTDLSRDARLVKPFTVQVKGATLAKSLNEIETAMGVPLRVSSKVDGRRVILFATKRPLRTVMEAAARVSGLIWRVLPPASQAEQSGYELRLSDGAEKREQRQMAASERRERQAVDTAQEALIQAAEAQIQQAENSDKPAFGKVLRTYDREQLRRAAAVAQVPPGLISANDQSHFYFHLLYSQPFSSLPKDAQTNVAALLKRPEYATTYAPPPADLANSQVGLIAANGFRLGIVGPDGKDVWVSPLDDVSSPSIPDEDRANDFDPNVTQLLAGTRLVALGDLPSSLRRAKLRFPASLDRARLANVLESVARQTGLSIAADDFLRTNRTPFSWVLTDKSEYTLPEALLQIARTFGHRIAYHSGVLFVETLTRGFDLRAEPPGAVLERWRELSDKRLPPGLEDYLALGRMSRLQLDLLMQNPPPGLTPSSAWLTARRLHGALRLYDLLTPEQREIAEEEHGLSIVGLDRPVRQAYAEVESVGLPGAVAALVDVEPGRLYVRRESDARTATATMTFLLTSSREPVSVTTYRLKVALFPTVPSAEALASKP